MTCRRDAPHAVRLGRHRCLTQFDGEWGPGAGLVCGLACVDRVHLDHVSGHFGKLAEAEQIDPRAGPSVGGSAV